MSPELQIQQNPRLPPTFANTTPPPVLQAQGAEALLYKTHFLTPSIPCALKYRPAKTWRHPTLDARLTRHRILAEARILVRCRREGVPVPAVLALDWEGSSASDSGASTSKPDSSAELSNGNVDWKRTRKEERSGGWMLTEWIPGGTVRTALEAWWKARQDDGQQNSEPLEGESALKSLLLQIGAAIGKLHSAGLVHGDLTSSNLMLRPLKSPSTSAPSSSPSPSPAPTDPQTYMQTQTEHPSQNPNRPPPTELQGDIVLIDFGLASATTAEEDRAVDLYVLERALASTHPWLESVFAWALDGYRGSYRGAGPALKKLEEVRLRGRKRSMLG
jgi:TP53 regulating kinase and related kinases